MDTDAILHLLQDVAERVIRPRFRALGVGEVDEKLPGDYVTVADRESEAEIGSALRAAFPGAVVIGEEGVFADPSLLDGIEQADHAFIIDPVDGTRNFVRGDDDYAVMLAEVRTGVATRGWIWQPEHALAFVGERGAGVTLNGSRMEPVKRPDRPLIASSIRPIRKIDAPELRGVRWTHFCCGVDYPKLLLGDFDVLAYGPPKPWDHLPGTLFVRELGGVARTTDGREYGPGSRGPAIIVGGDEHAYEVADRVIGDRIRR